MNFSPLLDGRPMTATLSRVASKAGVSTTTASLILNNRNAEQFAEETRRRVLEAAEALSYRKLRRRGRPRARQDATRAIAFLSSDKLGDTRSSYLGQILDGVQVAAREHGYQLYLCTGLADPDDRLEAVRAAGPAIGGLITGDPLDPRLEQLIEQHRLPVVHVGDLEIAGAAGHQVYGNNFDGGHLAAQYLINRGHRRIAFLGYQRLKEFFRQRLAGHCAAMLEAGLPIDPQLVCDMGDPDALPACLEALHAAGRLPTAVFAASAFTATRVMEWAQLRGVRVPEDLSVVAYDSMPAFARIEPALTTVEVSLEAIGRLAFAKLTDIIAEPGTPPSTTLVPPRLIERASTARCEPAAPIARSRSRSARTPSPSSE